LAVVRASPILANNYQPLNVALGINQGLSMNYTDWLKSNFPELNKNQVP